MEPAALLYAARPYLIGLAVVAVVAVIADHRRLPTLLLIS